MDLLFISCFSVVFPVLFLFSDNFPWMFLVSSQCSVFRVHFPLSSHFLVISSVHSLFYDNPLCFMSYLLIFCPLSFSLFPISTNAFPIVNNKKKKDPFATTIVLALPRDRQNERVRRRFIPTCMHVSLREKWQWVTPPVSHLLFLSLDCFLPYLGCFWSFP